MNKFEEGMKCNRVENSIIDITDSFLGMRLCCSTKKVVARGKYLVKGVCTLFLKVKEK